ncbi:cytochrome-c peroxidase [Commensalibacter papalotli (ex Servin-Garciduenas et al. 2014)]|uniref:Cytochrome-c peroxidase n=1 Tax=Commensalibacter papalotli (ex Servin-Garciduenas et al. 2014) TaxID=1208583 RepID=W7DKC0_9PROT|nr:cytochrome c peroxidase [Commensalibacter papalotli (ex Servin-Garciduenas et al. 2014)]EUK17797.1 cytochrome-c peroxidase [Commensalibacter papalotli (ex Servin-Garciduenas et al. 2014)]
MNLKIIFATFCIIGTSTGALLYAQPRKTEIHSAQVPAAQEKIKLGRYLFYDGDLSKDGSMSCGTCHRQKHAFTDGNKTHPGVNNDEGIFNVPTLGNIGEFNHLTWENQNVRTLEQHAVIPITGTIPVEMGMNQQEKEIERRIAANPCYVELFNKAFPDAQGDSKNKVTIDHIIQAISDFERTLITNQSIWDTKKGFSFEMQQGETIFFGKGQCTNCHTPPLFTDQKFYKINDHIKSEIRTPTLRNIELTAPYFHDGSIATIQEAIIGHSPSKTNVPKLSQQEINELIAFLNSLTDQKFITNPNFSLPPAVCEKTKSSK